MEIPHHALLFVSQLGWYAWLLLSKLWPFLQPHASRLFSKLKRSGFSQLGKDGDHLRFALVAWACRLSQPTPHRAPCPQQGPRRPCSGKVSHGDHKPACSRCRGGLASGEGPEALSPPSAAKCRNSDGTAKPHVW